MSVTRGIVLREEDGALVVRPTDGEVRAFGAGSRVAVRKDAQWWARVPDNPDPAAWQQHRAFRKAEVVLAIMEVRRGDWLYDAQGRPVGRAQLATVTGSRPGQFVRFETGDLLGGSGRMGVPTDAFGDLNRPGPGPTVWGIREDEVKYCVGAEYDAAVDGDVVVR